MKIVNRLILKAFVRFRILFFSFNVIPQLKNKSHSYDLVKSFPFFFAIEKSESARDLIRKTLLM